MIFGGSSGDSFRSYRLQTAHHSIWQHISYRVQRLLYPAKHPQRPSALRQSMLDAALATLTLIITLSMLHAVVLPANAVASEALTINADQQFSFAEELFAQQQYAQAIAEYRRFTHFFPRDPRVETALLRIGQAFYNAERYSDAIEAFNAVIDRYETNATAIQAYFRLSDSFLAQNRAGQAAITLQNVLALIDIPEIRDKTYYRLGWVYISAGSWERAQDAFDQMSPSSRERYRLEELGEELSQADQIKLKDPQLAGALSILPGAGQMYCERYQDGIFALLLNGGLILAAYESFDEDLPALGAVITLVEIGFYTGNIYGAISSAHKYNRDQTQRFIDRLNTNTKIDLSLNREQEGLVLSLQYRF
jgi:tetratricopeptide (TPR) repeat protein